MTESGDKIIPEIIKCVNSNDIDGVKDLILQGEVKVDVADENGMTPLQHAAYKGQTEICRLLLKYGAEVNADTHDHKYSALHFSALSGKVETTHLLLQSGARTHHTNSLGRTAAQMAGFVGNHEIVALINNYVPLEEILYYTKIQGLEKEPKLKIEVAKPLYDILMKSTLHPVFHAIRVGCSNILMENLVQASNILKLMCEKEAKRTDNVNEVICLKFHYLSFLLRAFHKELEKENEKKNSDKLNSLSIEADKAESEKSLETKKDDKIQFEPLIRKWLKATPNGFEPNQDVLIRDAVREFPYSDLPIFMQVVRSLSGENLAIDVLSSSINGQRGFDDAISCFTCGLENSVSKKCSKCKSVQYCNRLCQRLHWGTHKRMCERLMKESLGSAKIPEKKTIADNTEKVKIENDINEESTMKNTEAISN